MTELATVYLPRPGSFAERRIRRGSGIVGRRAAGVGRRVQIDFEGAIYGQVNMARYAERVMHADGRQKVNYPTVARIVVDADDLVRVGTFDREARRVDVDDDKREAVAAWLGLPVEQLDDQLEAPRW